MAVQPSAESSFEDFYRREFPRLVRSLGVAFGEEPSADAVQEAFLIAHRQWRSVSDYSSPETWVRRVALNKLMTDRRTRARRARILAAVRPPEVESLTTGHLEMLDLVRRLPVRQRVVVCLYYVADLSTEEIADVMGISQGTVKSHLFDARSNLRAIGATDAEPAL